MVIFSHLRGIGSVAWSNSICCRMKSIKTAWQPAGGLADTIDMKKGEPLTSSHGEAAQPSGFIINFDYGQYRLDKSQSAS